MSNAAAVGPISMSLHSAFRELAKVCMKMTEENRVLRDRLIKENDNIRSLNAQLFEARRMRVELEQMLGVRVELDCDR